MSDDPGYGAAPPENPQAPPPPPTEPVGGPGVPPPKDEQNLAVLAHLLGALVGFLGPLIIWLIKKDQSAYVGQESREALNFQLTMLIGYLIATAISLVTCGIGAIAYVIPFIGQLVFGIIGAVTAAKGQSYIYPFSVRLIT